LPRPSSRWPSPFRSKRSRPRRRRPGGSTAPAQVFAPNPVADLGIQTLTDQKDADYFSADPALARAAFAARGLA